MAVNFFFQDRNIRYNAQEGYLHFFSANADVDPSSVYQQITDARSRIATIAAQTQIANGDVSMKAAPLDIDTRQTVERLLSMRLFDDLDSDAVSMDGEDISVGESIVGTLESIASEFDNKMVNVDNFAETAKSVLQQLFDAANIKIVADDYCSQVLAEYISNNNLQGVAQGDIAAQIINSIVGNNNGEFFSIDQPIGGGALSNDIAQMAALVAAIPSSGLSGGEMATSGTRHTKIETLLAQKFSGWMNAISKAASKLASAIGLGEVVSKALGETVNASYRIGTKADTVVKVDPQLIHDEQAVREKLARMMGAKSNSGAIEVKADMNGVTTKFAVVTKSPSAAPITPKSNHRSFYIIEDTSLLTVLARHAGIGGNSLHQLIQILTYHDSSIYSPVQMEAAADVVWNAILEVVPYLALMNKLAFAFTESGATYANTFFAYGGKIWPSGVVLSHILHTIGSRNDFTKSAAFLTGNFNIDRGTFVDKNRWISNTEDGGRERADTSLAIERSATLHTEVLSTLMAAKVNVRVRLAELAVLSMSSLI